MPTVIYGWLKDYAQLIAARDRLGLPLLSATEGYGTTEYMRFSGGYGATIECGSHDDPQSAEMAYRAIANALATLSLIDAERPESPVKSVIHMNEVIICEAEGDKLEGDWKTGDAVAAGSPIARRANGEIVVVPTSGFIIFPSRRRRSGRGSAISAS